MLHCPAQRLAHVALRKRRDRAEQRVRDVSSGGRRHAQQTLRPAVESGHALQQQVAQAARKLAARVAGGSEELLGEEGVALRAGDDLVRQRSPAGSRRYEPRAAPRARRAPSGPSSSKTADPERRTPICEAAHALRRRRLVRAVGREQQNRPVVEVVREEDDEIERRGIRPVQVLEHEQHRCGGRAVGEQRERVLEYAQLRAGPRVRRPAEAPRADAGPRRTAGTAALCRRDRSSARAGPRTRRRGHVPRARTRAGVLPMPASPATRTVVPLPACAASSARSSSPSSRARPTKTSLARASIPASIAQLHPQPVGRS